MSKTLDIHATLFVSEVTTSGAWLAWPIGEPRLVGYGIDETPEDLFELFLQDELSRAPADVLAAHGTPPGTKLHIARLHLVRPDLPRQLQFNDKMSVACILRPLRKDLWVTIVPLDHTFFVPLKSVEKAGALSHSLLDKEIGAEFARFTRALELTPPQWLGLLPGIGSELVPLTIPLDRSALYSAQQVGGVVERVAKSLARSQARSVLKQLARPLFADPRVQAGAPIVGRESSVRALGAILGGTDKLSALLVGPELCGKTAVLHSWYAGEREAAKREDRSATEVFVTSVAEIIAGASSAGAFSDRIWKIAQSCEQLDAVLYFSNLAELLAERSDSATNVAAALRPYVERRQLRIVGELRPDAVDRFERRFPAFFELLTRLTVEPTDAKVALTALEARREWAAETAADRPNLKANALSAIVELVDRYVPYRSFPGKAARLFDELRSVHAEATDGNGEPVDIGRAEVYRAFALQSGVPEFLLRDDRILKATSVADSLRKRIIGQQAAIDAVVETVCVIKARLQPVGKPLASLLFAGPTGVGKTELARALAEFLFGSPDRLMRFDMSEFMDPGAAMRLIVGGPAASGEGHSDGMLTRRIRQQPFAVVLFDEIEKAHPAVFDLLLQLLGEGRLTDARGQTASFDNAIIILTSNVGARDFKARSAGFGQTDVQPQDHYRSAVLKTFRPEFVNRLDRIVAFAPLEPAEVRHIADFQVAAMAARRGFSQRGITLEVTDDALAKLAQGGYDRTYGARALRRHLERSIITTAARRLCEDDASNVSVMRFDVSEAPPNIAGEGVVDAKADVANDKKSQGVGLHVVLDKDRKSASYASVPTQIAAIRRAMVQAMGNPLITEIEDRIGLLTAQMVHLQEGKPRSERAKARASRAISELSHDHASLAPLIEVAHGFVTDVEVTEDLAIMEYYADGDGTVFLDEATALSDRFMRHCFGLLVAMQPARNDVIVMVTALDNGKGFLAWLVPMLDAARERSWQVDVHFDTWKYDPKVKWPRMRRWGPPEAPAAAIQRIASGKVGRHVLVRVRGETAGALVGLEGGLMRVAVEGGNDNLLVRPLAYRGLAEADWDDDLLVPPTPDTFEALKKLDTHRIFLASGRVVMGPKGSQTSANLSVAGYFQRWEVFAAETLLSRTQHGEEGDLFVGALDAGVMEDPDE